MSLVSALSSPKMSLNLLPSKSLSTTFSIPKTLPFTNTTPFPTIECSSRPQKKATAHHRKTRPRKSQAWDIKRGPCVYPPLPELPPDWSFVVSSEDNGAKESVEDSGSKVEIV